MRRFAFVLLLVPALAGAAPATLIFRHPADVRPAFAAGDLSGPSRLAPADAARAFLRSATDLAPVPPALLGAAHVRRLTGASIVRFDLSYAGLPIVDAQVVVRLDANGGARMVAGRPLRVEDAGPATPTLAARDAQELLAATHAPRRAEYVRATTPRLVWMPGPNGALRLVWELRLPVVPVLREALLFRVDAHSGALVTVRNLVRFADQAKVYEVNPLHDSDTLTQVTLGDLDPPSGTPPEYLGNPWLKVVNCIDNHTMIPLNLGGYSINAHMCDEIPTVAPDANGDFLQYAPVNGAWTTPTGTPPAEDAAHCAGAVECDPYAELSMYWHVMKVYRYFQAFNDARFTELDAKPIQATVNFRVPFDSNGGGFDVANITNPNGILYPLDNAMFMPPGQLIPGLNRPASIVFFQGTQVDFSYDADVIYHEFTHAVVWSTSDLTGPELDEQGLDGAPGAINEGMADDFSSFLTGDSVEGEWSLGGLGAQRDLTAHHTCPDLLWGEVHQDSAAISEPVWTLHETYGTAVEKPVFTALAGLTTDSDFEVTTAAIESAVGDALGDAAKTAAHAAFVDHGVADCQRVVTYAGPRDLLMSAGTAEVGVDPAPGYLQFKYTIADRATNLKVDFDWSAGLTSMFGGGSAAYTVYVRKGAPITWSYGVSGAVGTKDYAITLSAPTQTTPHVQGALPDVLEPGDYYLMIVATGEVGGTLQNITITHDAAPQDDAAVPPPQDDAGAGDDGGTGPNVNGRDGGCGCRAAGSAAAAPLLLALLALFLLRRRS